MTRLGPTAGLLLAAALLAGCAEREVPRWTDVNPPTTGSPGPTAVGPVPDPSGSESVTVTLEQVRAPREGVLYDDDWVVEEGVWDLGDPGKHAGHMGRAFRGQANGLLGAGSDGVVVVRVPGLYGKYRTRVQLLDRRPAVPRRCEDVVEVSLRSDGELAMSSFETFSDTWQVPPGTYRVRSCATGLDRAATEDEFDGDDYRTYTGRHLFQLWPAPPAPDAVVRVGSDWAAAQHRPVG